MGYAMAWLLGVPVSILVPWFVFHPRILNKIKSSELIPNLRAAGASNGLKPKSAAARRIVKEHRYEYQ
jgi:hypothetical protein